MPENSDVKMVRVKANAWALLAICWTLFSVGGIVGIVIEIRRLPFKFDLFGFLFCASLLLLHALFIGLSIHYFKTETPRAEKMEYSGITFDEFVLPEPRQIDVHEFTRKQIRTSVVTGFYILHFAVFIFAAWYFEQISVMSMQGFAFMLAFLLAGYVVYTTLKMNLLWRQHRAYLKLQQAEKTPSSLD